MRTQMKFPTGRTPAGGHGGHQGSALLLSSNHLHGSHARQSTAVSPHPQRVQEQV